MLYFLTTFLACQEPQQVGFSSSGTGVNPNELGSTQSGTTESGSSGGGNSGGGISTGDLAAADNDDAPQISGVDAFFTEYEGQGDIIEVHVYYTDAQDDVEGGNMTLAYSNGETEGTESIDLEETNAAARLESAPAPGRVRRSVRRDRRPRRRSTESRQPTPRPPHTGR